MYIITWHSDKQSKTCLNASTCAFLTILFLNSRLYYLWKIQFKAVQNLYVMNLFVFLHEKKPLHVFLEKFFDWLIHRWLCSFSIGNSWLFMAKKVFKLRLYEKQKKIPRWNSTCTGNFHTISSMTSNTL